MRILDLNAVLEQCVTSGRSWLEFLRVPALSMGIYYLKAGQSDGQRPHTEDEVYYVLEGRGKFHVGGEQVTIEAGRILFVEKLVEHRFVEITEDLTILVLFVPAERSQASTGAT
jgi:quercetin dioxygenase-like cupin family protein